MILYPKITIITPTFNQAQYLEKTILSVVNQNYPNLEYIIIDGGSKDGSVEIIKKYSVYLKYWISENDKGQSDAINKGIQHASGDIINWLNSDDVLNENVLYYIADVFEKKDILLFCGYSELHYPNKKILKRSTESSGSIEKDISTGNTMQPSTFWRKKIFDEFAPLQTSLHYMMDHYLWIQFIIKYGFNKIYFSDIAVANVLMHDKAKSVAQIDKFHYEKQKIFVSLYKSFNKKCLAYSPVESKSILKFNYDNNITIDFEKMNFYLLWEQLFFRNNFGERTKLNWVVLFNVIHHYPKQFYFKALTKIINLKNL